MIQKIAHKLSIALIAVGVMGGCVRSKMERRLDILREKQSEEYWSVYRQLQDNKAERLDWKRAYRMLMEQNIGVQQSNLQLESAKRMPRDQWLSLIPNVSSYLGLSASLNQLTDLSRDNVNGQLVAGFTIPNPVNFYGNLYASELQKLNAELNHELDQRRVYAELYQTFLEEKQLQEMERQAFVKKQSSQKKSDQDVATQYESWEAEKQALLQRRAFQRARVNQLLNTPGKNWVLEGGLPALSYRNKFENIEFGEDFGKLALNLQAIQIEGSLLNIYQIKFQQWPMISFGLSVPSVYSFPKNSNRFSSDSLWFFSGINKGFTMVDPLGFRQLRDAKKRLEFTRSQLRQQMESEIGTLKQGKLSYRGALMKEKIAQKHLEQLATYRTTNVELVLKDIEAYQKWKRQELDAQERMQQLDLQFMIWDDAHWK